MSWDGHWHGYGWAGNAAEYFKEAIRRPGPGGLNDAHTQMFVNSKVPPMMTGHWLMRRAQTSADCTWTDVCRTVDWLRRRYEENPPITRTDGGQAYVDVSVRIDYALDVLPRGVDVTWGYWTSSSTLASHSVVACANHFHPNIPCPLEPASTRRPDVAQFAAAPGGSS
jgi:hypothetical protein